MARSVVVIIRAPTNKELIKEWRDFITEKVTKSPDWPPSYDEWDISDDEYLIIRQGESKSERVRYEFSMAYDALVANGLKPQCDVQDVVYFVPRKLEQVPKQINRVDPPPEDFDHLLGGLGTS